MNRPTFSETPKKAVDPLALAVCIPSALWLPLKGTGGYGLPRTNKNPSLIARHSPPKGHGRGSPFLTATKA
jgi:hypothetical protein